MAGWLLAEGPSAWDLYEQGRDEEKAGHIVKAYLLYAQASALEPKNRTYFKRSQALKPRAAMEANVAAASSQTAPTDVADAPEQTLDLPTVQDRIDARKPLPPAELSAEPGIRDFDLRGDSKKLFEDVAHAYGLDCVFDGDYQPFPEFRFQLKDVDYRIALHGLEAATSSFVVPLSEKLFLVARDTPQKRTEVEPTVAMEIRLPEATTQQDFAAMVAAVQQTLALEKVSWDTQTNTVIVRDRVSKMMPARVMFDDLLNQKAQVMIEMQLITVSRNDTVTYGLDFPTLFSLSPLTTWMNNKVSIPQGIAGLLTFGGGKTLFGLGFVTPSLVAQLTSSCCWTVQDKSFIATRLPNRCWPINLKS